MAFSLSEIAQIFQMSCVIFTISLPISWIPYSLSNGTGHMLTNGFIPNHVLLARVKSLQSSILAPAQN